MPYIDDGFEALLEPFYNGKKLTDPISTVEDKNQLLPAFLKVKGMYEICMMIKRVIFSALTHSTRFGETVCLLHEIHEIPVGGHEMSRFENTN